MSSGEIECSNTLEDALDQALPSQAFVYRPVRQRVYSLLLGDGRDVTSTCPTVKEWFVYSGNPLRHPDLVRPLQMNIPGGPRASLLSALPHSAWAPVQGLHQGRARHAKRSTAVGPSPLPPDPRAQCLGFAQ
ncbi:constitutive coactivator of peroxisome proliferator-activated receptor gamma-like [Leptonychotes weddellii]|uniref:Constitutive coactivator of peroxisome proliferator-activated receptor gamma-like n=1 Tax=Leptonychotes weddellii TaxID=9713 RepID=A0A2U3YQX1_LEPWE|nr:constitutive coactivator of peroxisome proliferator-activated receptor gamma-like [Leptonychotes weddellii]